MQPIEVGPSEVQIAIFCRALSNPLRVGILRFIAAHPGCIGNDIVQRTDRAQSTISGHLQVLVHAGLIECEADGQASAYHVAPDVQPVVLQVLAMLDGAHNNGRVQQGAASRPSATR